jgi:hypothetical protein
MNRDAFRTGYMTKAAGYTTDLLQAGLNTTMDAAGWTLKNLGAGAALLPVAVGLPAGVLASKLTSPSTHDLKNLENTIMLAELRKAESELKREAQVLSKQHLHDIQEGANAKEIRALV